MFDKSSYDLNNEYRSLMTALIKEATDVRDQYKYDDFPNEDYSVSYIKNDDWYLETDLKRKGIKEYNTLRKGTKNYRIIYRNQGIIKKIDIVDQGDKDVTYFAVYRNNKRYLLPFDEKYRTHYPTYVIVTEYRDDYIYREYMVNDAQIVFEQYSKISETEFSFIKINYIPNGKYPVNGCSVGITNADYSYTIEKSYCRYDEFNCIRKSIPFENPEIPWLIKK